MKLSYIKEKAAEKARLYGTYHINDGAHSCELLGAQYKRDSDRVILRFRLEDDTIFKCSTDIADYSKAPLYDIIEPYFDEEYEFDFDDIRDLDVQIVTETKESSDGKKFSNIKEFHYSDDDYIRRYDPCGWEG